MDYVTKIGGWITGITRLSVGLIALGVVWQVLFGSTIPFIGGDVVGNITGLIGGLGDAGLVGLLTVGVLFWLFRHVDDPDY